MPRGCRANEKVISAFDEEYVQRLQVSVVSGPRNQIKKSPPARKEECRDSAGNSSAACSQENDSDK
jgi:hypothetical protein